MDLEVEEMDQLILPLEELKLRLKELSIQVVVAVVVFVVYLLDQDQELEQLVVRV